MDNKRFLLELEKTIKEINRQEIDPKFAELNMDSIVPVMTMVAKARADYLEALFAMAANGGDGKPGLEQIKRLNVLRRTYEELVSGAMALETAIERGYVSVKSR